MNSVIKKPSAWLPIVMSAAVLATCAIVFILGL